MLACFLVIKDIAKEAEEVIFTECVYCVMKQVAVLQYMYVCVCAHVCVCVRVYVCKFVCDVYVIC